MKIIITESQFVNIVEQTKSDYEFYELLDESTREVFNSIANKQKIRFRKIKPTQYKQALTEFMKYRKFFRFPVKYIFKWKDMILENIAMLNALTEIHGHTSNFPYDEFYDTFNDSQSYTSDQYDLFTNDLTEVTPDGQYDTWIKAKVKETGDKNYLKKYDFGNAYEFLESIGIDDYIPFFSNGHAVLTDFGLDPLLKLAQVLSNQSDPTDIIVTINKILDISHQRSDLSELFIEGGGGSLDDISNG